VTIAVTARLDGEKLTAQVRVRARGLRRARPASR
jgi:hypothetical protein